MAVSRMHWAAHFWPGLPLLWSQGSWRGLGFALGFALALDVALLGTLVYPELLPGGTLPALVTLLALMSCGSAAFGWRGERRRAAPGGSVAEESAYGEALEYYLQGNWYEAENRLVAVLQHNPKDVDARLLIATLLRRTRRLDEAARQLDQLQRLELSRKWELEISRERGLLAEAEAARGAAEDSETTPSGAGSPPSELGQAA